MKPHCVSLMDRTPRVRTNRWNECIRKLRILDRWKDEQMFERGLASLVNRNEAVKASAYLDDQVCRHQMGPRSDSDSEPGGRLFF